MFGQFVSFGNHVPPFPIGIAAIPLYRYVKVPIFFLYLWFNEKWINLVL